MPKRKAKKDTPKVPVTEEATRTLNVGSGELAGDFSEGDPVILSVSGTVKSVNKDGSLVVDVASVSQPEEPATPTEIPEMPRGPVAPAAPVSEPRIASILRRRFGM